MFGFDIVGATCFVQDNFFLRWRLDNNIIFKMSVLSYVAMTFSGQLTKAVLLLIIPANLPGDTGVSPWNRHAKPGSAREMELLLKTCAVSAFLLKSNLTSGEVLT